MIIGLIERRGTNASGRRFWFRCGRVYGESPNHGLKIERLGQPFWRLAAWRRDRNVSAMLDEKFCNAGIARENSRMKGCMPLAVQCIQVCPSLDKKFKDLISRCCRGIGGEIVKRSLAVSGPCVDVGASQRMDHFQEPFFDRYMQWGQSFSIDTIGIEVMLNEQATQ